jgi:hypothetical protein
MMRRALAALTFLCTVAAAQQPPPAPAPQPAPPQTPAPGPTAPAPGPTSLPTAVGTPTLPPGPPTPAPTPTPVYRYVYAPTPAPAPSNAGLPRIFEIDVTDQILHPNSDIALRVVTSPEVQTVIASALGRDIAIPQLAPGVFAAQSHIPDVPFFLLRTYDVEFRAATVDGRIASVTLPFRLGR